MKKQGRCLVLITILFIIEDIVLLNILFIVLICIFNLRFDVTYQIVFILINLGYLLSFLVISVDFNDVKQLHISHLIRRNIFKLFINHNSHIL